MSSVADTSEAGIANEALSAIQSQARITSLDDEHSKAARHARQHFATTRDGLLRGYVWNFANFWIEIAQALPAPIAGGYVSAFALPGDCLRVIEVAGLTKKQWTVEHDLRLLANSGAPAKVRIVRQVTNPAKWDALFRTLMINALAQKLAPALARSRSIRRDLVEEYNALVMNAKRVDSYEKDEDGTEGDFLSSYITARV